MTNVPAAALASSPTPSHVVGIGASAGGLEALERFFAHVPPRSGMAYVVVQHLSPDFKSLMEELLARHTGLPIHLVENGMEVEADHVYLIPPKKEMIIADGHLLLSERERTHELVLPIDTFFRSLAQDCGPRAIAVVLSGAGGDGSRGIKDVHDAGGLVVVQDEDSAQFDGMPRSARDAGVADLVLAPDDMPAALVEHTLREGSRPSTRVAEPPTGLDAVYHLLEGEFGIDFTHYKPSTVTRRIERRLQMVRAQNVTDYLERLRRGHGELDVLYRDLLIGVTRFFRNEEAFEVLEHEVLPDLLRRGPKDVPFRVWVAGCATGEEAYSLAILLSDLAADHGGRAIQIFATDVHPGSIEQAARATYGQEAIANVGPRRLERYFLRRGDTYQITPDIRQTVVFAQHNVIKDAPFTRMDLVSCRNMLIYLQPPAQQKVLSLFHFALSRGGVLFLGPSESPGAMADDFEPIDRHWRIYRKYRDLRAPVEPRAPRPRPDGPRMPALATSAHASRQSLASLLTTYDALLDQTMPPSLLVDERGELVHAFGGASRYLRTRDGRQDLLAVDSVEPDLRTVLLGGLGRLRREGGPLVFNGVRLAHDGTEMLHTVTLTPVRGKRDAGGHVLVKIEITGTLPQRAAGTREIDLDEASRERLRALEGELSYTKENLQAAVEQLETSNEELQATNEELLASNEELQSTNEELQSVNEELYTVNAEYQRKIAELTELTNDIDNLLASTDVGAIFLDSKLRLRKFTPQIAESFTLLPQDVGRSIETFTHRLELPDLTEILRRVLTTGVPVEREIAMTSGRAYFLRILPYRANGAVAGVVMTLIDVSGLRAAEDALFHERHLLNSLLSSSPDAIYFKDAGGRFIRVNEPMAERLQLRDPRDAEGKTAFELPDQSTALALHRSDESVLRSGQAQAYRLERRQRADGGEGWDLVTRLPMLDRTRQTVGVIGVYRDVTAQKLSDERIREGMRRRDEFLAMLSHELRNPLNALVSATSLLEARDLSDERRAAVLQVVERQTKQMARLLDDLLEVARVTQNKIELRRATIDLRVVLRDACDAARGLMEGRGVRFDAALGDVPLPVHGDPARLQQVHVNLLNNAAKYTPRGGCVRMTSAIEDDEVVVRVIDDGVGIAPEMLDQVFELFVQSHRTLDRSEGGLGVGLTLVRSLVQMHGGTVRVESDGDGRGSEFVVRFPRSREPMVTLPTPSSEPPAKATRGGSIVIIEDNVDSRELLCELLTRAGYTCESSGRGDDGLQRIREVRPDVALVDVGVPGIDGFEVARGVRRDRTLDGVFLVALTGYGRPEDRARAIDAGFDAHLVKPVNTEHLLGVLAADRTAERAPANAN